MANEAVTKKGTKKTSTTKSRTNKVATGSTKKIVQSRSSSVAGKKSTAKKENTTKATTKVEKNTPKTTRKKVSTEREKKNKKATETKKTATSKSVEATKKAISQKEADKKTTTKKVEKKANIELKEKKTKATTSKKGKHSLTSKEVSNVEKALEEAIETAKQEILKKVREENKIEIPTIEELLKKAGITETESLVNKRNTPKREEFLSLEEDENLEDEDTDEEFENEDDEIEEEEYDEEAEEEQPKTRLQKRREREITEVVGKEIKKNRKVDDRELGKIHTRVFQNICLAVAMMLYLNFVVLGFVNIENPVFVTDLKVFSIALLVIAIGVFEYAYKRDSGRHAIHGIEVLMLAFATMAFIYVDLMWQGKFVYIVALFTFLFAIYYVAKSIIVYNKMKKQYFINEMKKVIKRR